MTQCPLCLSRTLETDEQRAIQMCGDCAYQLGVIAMPPALRPPTPCAKCQGRKFTRIIPREHAVGTGSRQISAPMLATHAPKTFSSFGFNVVEPLDPKAGFGLLELYACWACGAVEWYCRDVPRIPIHPHLMTEVIELDAAGPYR